MRRTDFAIADATAPLGPGVGAAAPLAPG